MDSVKNLNKQFSTADAEDIEYVSDGYTLTLKFVDWSGAIYTLSFEDVEFLKITEEIDYEKFNYDCPHEITSSSQVQKMNLDEKTYHHYMLCFNAWSNMEIISQELKILNKVQSENT